MAQLFIKGKSGNPGGLSSAEHIARRLLATMIAEKTDHGREIIEFVIGVMRGEVKECNTGKDRRWAAAWLGDRLYGRAQQHIEVTKGGSAKELDVRAMTMAELRAAAAEDSEDGGDAPPGNVH